MCENSWLLLVKFYTFIEFMYGSADFNQLLTIVHPMYILLLFAGLNNQDKVLYVLCQHVLKVFKKQFIIIKKCFTENFIKYNLYSKTTLNLDLLVNTRFKIDCALNVMYRLKLNLFKSCIQCKLICCNLQQIFCIEFVLNIVLYSVYIFFLSAIKLMKTVSHDYI